MKVSPVEKRVLWAKYLDWCSAQIADRFLELTPDRIYELAHHLPDRSGSGGGAVVFSNAGAPSDGASASSFTASATAGAAELAGGDRDGGLTYRALVARVTEALASKLSLPSFEEWAAAYRAAPDRYESELLGLWRGASGASSSGVSSRGGA